MNDSDEALRKAQDFADTAHADAVSRSTKDLQYQLAIQRNQFAARGILRSGNMLHATAQLYGRHIDDVVLAKVESLLEGYELHNIPLDEQLAARIINDAMRLKDVLLISATETVSDVDRGGIFTPEQFAQQAANECKVSRASVITIVERRRLKPRERSGMSIVYQVSGYARVNVNSTDNSVNVVTVSQDEIFTKLRAEITTHVPAGLQQEELLQRLAALEAAQNSPSFAGRYADLISVAANHVTLLAPFLPALADMVLRH